MYKVLVFGTGEIAEKYIPYWKPRMRELNGEFEIVGYLDNNKQKHGQVYCEKKIYSPAEGLLLDYDQIAVFTGPSAYRHIVRQLSEFFSVPLEQIHYYTWYLKECYIRRYSNSKDDEVQALIAYWQNHDMSMYNLYGVGLNDHKWYEVFDDVKTGLPYVWLENATGDKRKLYYPSDWDFFILDGYNRCMIDVLGEQHEHSPHKYTKVGHDVADGDIIVDAGACEGNFALYYAEVAGGLYLFEPDSRWQKPLRCTFAPYEEKTTLFFKALGEKSYKNSISLDEAVLGKVDFLKVDVEGAETYTIQGGVGVLSRSRVKCSVCSYHRYEDERKIKQMFNNLGYKTSLSNGFLISPELADIWEHCDLRRAMIYAHKQ